MKGIIAKTWDKILHIGVTASMSEPDIKAEILTNKLVVLTAGAAFMLLSLMFVGYLFYGYYAYFYFQVPAFLLTLVLLFLRLKFGRLVAFNFIIFLAFLYFTCFFLFMGESFSVYVAYTGCIMAPFLYLKDTERKSLVYSLTLPLVSIVFMQFWLRKARPLYPLNKDFQDVFSYLFLYFIILAILFINYHTWKHSIYTEKKLEAEREKSDKLLLDIIPKIMQTEKRYRHLVENSNDIIFSLDKDLMILTMNNAMKKELELLDHELIATNFVEIVHRDPGLDAELFMEIIGNYINDLVVNKSSISFKTSLKSVYNLYPKDFAFKLEYTEYDGVVEILGKGSRITQDKIIQFLEAEKQVFAINNNLSTIDLVSQKLTVNLNRFISADRISMLRVGLREILINAMEHGNLSLSFEEKTRAISKGNYLVFLRELQEDVRFRKRKIFVEYTVNANRVAYRVTDEGKGFDHEHYLKLNFEQANEEFLPHGRGLLLVLDIFDVIRFNEKGNQILLVKYFNSVSKKEPLFIPEDSF
ncbi:MAG: PAS domain-containing protein [bacterium]|nr:PAS domain-containing protein [bacterium]